MKKIFSFLLIISFIFSPYTTFADYNQGLSSDPIFMENVYGFIFTEDITTSDNLSYCEQVYLEATRRRAYSESEVNQCWKYFEKKNKEEMAYMQYMLNNRELFY